MTGFDYGRPPAVQPVRRGFGLDRANGKIGGVCAGIARWLGMNPLLVRIGFVAGTLLGFGSLLLVYLLVWFFAD